jgi:hypothetical protein
MMEHTSAYARFNVFFFESVSLMTINLISRSAAI